MGQGDSKLSSDKLPSSTEEVNLHKTLKRRRPEEIKKQLMAFNVKFDQMSIGILKTARKHLQVLAVESNKNRLLTFDVEIKYLYGEELKDYKKAELHLQSIQLKLQNVSLQYSGEGETYNSAEPKLEGPSRLHDQHSQTALSQINDETLQNQLDEMWSEFEHRSALIRHQYQLSAREMWDQMVNTEGVKNWQSKAIESINKAIEQHSQRKKWEREMDRRVTDESRKSKEYVDAFEHHKRIKKETENNTYFIDRYCTISPKDKLDENNYQYLAEIMTKEGVEHLIESRIQKGLSSAKFWLDQAEKYLNRQNNDLKGEVISEDFPRNIAERLDEARGILYHLAEAFQVMDQ